MVLGFRCCWFSNELFADNYSVDEKNEGGTKTVPNTAREITSLLINIITHVQQGVVRKPKFIAAVLNVQMSPP